MSDTTTDHEAQAIENALAEHDRKQAERRRKMSAAGLIAMAAALGVSVPMPIRQRMTGMTMREPEPTDTAAIEAAQRKRDRKAVKAARDAERAKDGG